MSKFEKTKNELKPVKKAMYLNVNFNVARSKHELVDSFGLRPDKTGFEKFLKFIEKNSKFK